MACERLNIVLMLEFSGHVICRISALWPSSLSYLNISEDKGNVSRKAWLFHNLHRCEASDRLACVDSFNQSQFPAKCKARDRNYDTTIGFAESINARGWGSVAGSMHLSSPFPAHNFQCMLRSRSLAAVCRSAEMH